jgi:glycosyltransferase involved in cell wall biosynthesis
MNILIVNHYAGSLRHGMEFRPYYLAREWIALGHKVRIVAASQSHLRQQPPLLTGGEAREEIDGVAYHWLRTPPYRGNGVRRAVNMAAFTQALHRRAKAIAGEFRPDVVIASSTYPFDIFPARRIARRARARLVFEVHDLWPLTLIELSGMSRWHPFILALSFAEKYAYRKADKVVSMLPAARGHMLSRGMAPEKYMHVPNGVDVKEWTDAAMAPPQGHLELLRGLRGQGKFVVGYAGGHGLSNALGNLLDAAELLRDDERIHIVLVGQGADKTELVADAQRRALANVSFLDAVPKAGVPALLSEFDALFLGWLRHPLYRFGVSPNKLMDYMMAAKPIVHAVEAADSFKNRAASAR